MRAFSLRRRQIGLQPDGLVLVPIPICGSSILTQHIAMITKDGFFPKADG